MTILKEEKPTIKAVGPGILNYLYLTLHVEEYRKCKGVAES